MNSCALLCSRWPDEMGNGCCQSCSFLASSHAEDITQPLTMSQSCNSATSYCNCCLTQHGLFTTSSLPKNSLPRKSSEQPPLIYVLQLYFYPPQGGSADLLHFKTTREHSPSCASSWHMFLQTYLGCQLRRMAQAHQSASWSTPP